MTVFFYQLDAQIPYFNFNTFIAFLYMLRALLCLTQRLVWSLSLGDRSVHRLWESSRNLCTERSPKTVTIPDAVLIQLYSWRWAQECSKRVDECNKCIEIKNLCIKSVKKAINIWTDYTRWCVCLFDNCCIDMKAATIDRTAVGPTLQFEICSCCFPGTEVEGRRIRSLNLFDVRVTVHRDKFL
jgi:hypothetical protein